MSAFTDQAEIQIRFQPFQLYPELPRLNPEGVDKENFFRELSAQRNPKNTDEQQKQGWKALQGAWKMDGLTLSERRGRLGNSFDAQRLILLARNQGREDAMIEAIYTANHENNLCLSDMSVLIDCAQKAGVIGADAMLKSEDLVEDVMNKFMAYREMGITAVPFLVFNDKFPIHGAPDRLILREAFKELISKGDEAQWPPKSAHSGMTVQDFVEAAVALVHNLTEEQRLEWSQVADSLDWSNSDARWFLLKEHILSGGSVRKVFGEGAVLEELRARLTEDVNPAWHAIMNGTAAIPQSHQTLSAAGDPGIAAK